MSYETSSTRASRRLIYMIVKGLPIGKRDHSQICQPSFTYWSQLLLEASLRKDHSLFLIWAVQLIPDILKMILSCCIQLIINKFKFTAPDRTLPDEVGGTCQFVLFPTNRLWIHRASGSLAPYTRCRSVGSDNYYRERARALSGKPEQARQLSGAYLMNVRLLSEGARVLSQYHSR